MKNDIPDKYFLKTIIFKEYVKKILTDTKPWELLIELLQKEEIVCNSSSQKLVLIVFSNNIWFLFIDQAQSDVVVFTMISFYIYKYIVTYWKHRIYINYIVKFNESLENLSMPIVELTNIDELSHEYGVVIFLRWKVLGGN